MLHEETGTLTGKAGTGTGNRQVLTGRAPADDVDRRQRCSIEFRNIAYMLHIWEVCLRYLDWEGFNLTCPQRGNAISKGCQWETSNSVKQAAHSHLTHLAATACTTVLVVLTAAWAVYTADMIFALVLVSMPKAPAIRGTSPAASIKPRPSKA